MPSQDGVWRNDAADLRQQLATQRLAPDSESAALVVVQPDALITQLLAEYAILFAEIVDHGILLPVYPAGQGHHQQMPGLKDHCGEF
jgi:hypothetical protein